MVFLWVSNVLMCVFSVVCFLVDGVLGILVYVCFMLYMVLVVMGWLYLMGLIVDCIFIFFVD